MQKFTTIITTKINKVNTKKMFPTLAALGAGSFLTNKLSVRLGLPSEGIMSWPRDFFFMMMSSKGGCCTPNWSPPITDPLLGGTFSVEACDINTRFEGSTLPSRPKGVRPRSGVALPAPAAAAMDGASADGCRDILVALVYRSTELSLLGARL